MSLRYILCSPPHVSSMQSIEMHTHTHTLTTSIVYNNNNNNNNTYTDIRDVVCTSLSHPLTTTACTIYLQCVFCIRFRRIDTGFASAMPFGSKASEVIYFICATIQHLYESLQYVSSSEQCAVSTHTSYIDIRNAQRYSLNILLFFIFLIFLSFFDDDALLV